MEELILKLNNYVEKADTVAGKTALILSRKLDKEIVKEQKKRLNAWKQRNLA